MFKPTRSGKTACKKRTVKCHFLEVAPLVILLAGVASVLGTDFLLAFD